MSTLAGHGGGRMTPQPPVTPSQPGLQHAALGIDGTCGRPSGAQRVLHETRCWRLRGDRLWWEEGLARLIAVSNGAESALGDRARTVGRRDLSLGEDLGSSILTCAGHK